MATYSFTITNSWREKSLAIRRSSALKFCRVSSEPTISCGFSETSALMLRKFVGEIERTKNCYGIANATFPSKDGDFGNEIEIVSDDLTKDLFRGKAEMLCRCGLAMLFSFWCLKAIRQSRELGCFSSISLSAYSKKQCFENLNEKELMPWKQILDSANKSRIIYKDENPADNLLAMVENLEETEKVNDQLDEDDSIDEPFQKATPLTVSLKIFAVRGSVPSRWIKEFSMAQGRHARLSMDQRQTPGSIGQELVKAMNGKKISRKSILAADLVSVPDQWLPSLISKGAVSPLKGAENSSWFQSLSSDWQRFSRRDEKGLICQDGDVYAVPYRWGSIAIAVRADLLKENGIPPITSWSDLWRPGLRGRVGLINSPREVVAICLKALGASANAQDFEAEVDGGREAVAKKLEQLNKQVRLYDSHYFLKALSAGDIWVAVGWSPDVIPFAEKATRVELVEPTDGSLIWADFWAVPATHLLDTKKLGGRIRGPSPLAAQWVEFCLQPARKDSFKAELAVGASPLELDMDGRGEGRNSEGQFSAEFLEPLTESGERSYSRLLGTESRSKSNR